MLIKNILPAIDRKWPVGWRRKTVLCQQDNASPHLSLDNAEFVISLKGKRLSIHLVNQPAQLLNLNVNNLGLFRSINCLRKKIIAKNLGELINAVHVAYNNLPVRTIDNAFVTLMAQMNKILRHGGGNNFPLSHTKKRQHEKKMGASVRTIKANIPTFIPTKASQPTYVINKGNVKSNNKTVNEENRDNNNGNNNNKDDVMNGDSFYGICLNLISYKAYRNKISLFFYKNE